jgi:ferredoxin
MDSTGDKALVMRSDLSGQEECVAEAIDTCPVGCMSWAD